MSLMAVQRAMTETSHLLVKRQREPGVRRTTEILVEASLSIGKEDHPEKVQLSILTTVEAAPSLTIVSSPSAVNTLQVHNKFGGSTPSPADIESAKLRGTISYLESGMGLLRQS